MLHGPAVHERLGAAEFGDNSTRPAGQTVQNGQPSGLKQTVLDLLRPTINSLAVGDLSSVIVHGREQKHLRVNCCSRIIKVLILSSLKTVHPAGIFGNEYPTKSRASLLFRLRGFEKRFPTVIATSSPSGVLYYKLRTSNKPVCVTSSAEVNKLEEKLLNSLAS